jgi:carbonic anhydrase/acetyltransferase-like protein (isoleucine patch superfamily)
VNAKPNLLSYDGVLPSLGRDVFIAPGAYVIGHVTIGDDASVWFGSVLRGDVGAIVIGARSNVQDLSMIHMTGGVSSARIGDDVTVGHGVTLHGCDIGDRCLIGMGSILLDGVKIGADCVIAAGTLLTPRMVIPAGSLVLGRPGKVMRAATDKERLLGPDGAAHYVENARKYRAMLAASEEASSPPRRSAQSPRRPPR